MSAKDTRKIGRNSLPPNQSTPVNAPVVGPGVFYICKMKMIVELPNFHYNYFQIYNSTFFNKFKLLFDIYHP